MPVVSEHDVRHAATLGRKALSVPPDAVITPQAAEVAEQLALRIVRGESETPSVPTVNPAQAVRRTLLRRNPRWISPPSRRGDRPARFTKLGMVGTGMVGTTAAHLCAITGMTDELVLIDVVPGTAAGTALDLEHASGITGSSTRVSGGTSLSLVAGCDVVVVTAGRPRTPGMTRADLIEVNGRVVADTAAAVAEHAPDAVVIVVTNPVDEMTYRMWDASGLPEHRVLGMAGTLDSSRFRNALAAAAGVAPSDVDAIALGSHGAEMVPLVSSAAIKGQPLQAVLDESTIERCTQETINGGAAVVGLRQTGSAFVAPAHATVELLDTMRGARPGPVPVSTMLRGDYGVDGVFLGVPARLGQEGVLEVVQRTPSADEQAALHTAADAIRQRLDL